MSISSTGPFLIEMPGAPCRVGGFALSIALSTLLEMMLSDLGRWPDENAISEGHFLDGRVRSREAVKRR